MIVETGQRSGALTVAHAARELGRSVYGVPGPIRSAASAGVNDMIRTRVAEVVTSADQITI